MGTGFTIDTPLRVARFGISSVMSLVDDELVERVRRHYAGSSRAIATASPDARALRITAWLDLVSDRVARGTRELRDAPLLPGTEKWKYFELLPDDSEARRRFLEVASLPPGAARDRLARPLDDAIVAGSADCNIMAKLDRPRFGAHRRPLAPEESDAKAALRGFVRSKIESNLVLSAGVNPSLLAYLATFDAFRSVGGSPPRKGVILKVSDLRSAIVQTKLLARRGIRLVEIRVESGLNCGGHAFPTEGVLLGPVLAQIRDARESLEAAAAPGELPIRVTAQGGLGTFGETRRLREHYGVDGTGWGTPFLLVPEATALDEATRERIAAATEGDLWTSDASPLGLPFNDLRGTSSEAWTLRRIAEGRPGSPCPRGYLASTTDVSSRPMCTASGEYQRTKLRRLGWSSPPRWEEADEAARAVYRKRCICHHLGNGALIALGLARRDLPVAVCPGPNAAYFDRTYTLQEMVDHLYGRGPSLVPATRPHVFAKELDMYVDELFRLAASGAPRLETFRANLQRGFDHYRALVRMPAFAGENLDSLARAIEDADLRLQGTDRPREDRIAE
jgi:hypothetical protein